MTSAEPAAPPPAESPKPTPAALAVADLARLLTRVGAKPITEAMITADIAAGAPTNPDGTLNIVHYGAWLIKEDRGPT